MLVRIDAASERPIYAQIADAVRRAVATGALGAGDRLPPAGEIAIGLGVNKHTVLHAYQALRDEGLVDLRRGRGAVVTPLAAEVVSLQHEAASIAERARVLGISPQTLAALLGDAHQDAGSSTRTPTADASAAIAASSATATAAAPTEGVVR